MKEIIQYFPCMVKLSPNRFVELKNSLSNDLQSSFWNLSHSLFSNESLIFSYHFVWLDTLVKVTITSHEGKKLKKKKTLVQKATTSPEYNEEIVFTNLKKEQLDNIVIRFTLYHDSLRSRENLGVVSICSVSTGNELVQWKDMLDGKKSIAWWHALTLPESDIDSDINSGSQSKINDKCQSLSERKSSKVNLLAGLSLLKIKPVWNTNFISSSFFLLQQNLTNIKSKRKEHFKENSELFLFLQCKKKYFEFQFVLTSWWVSFMSILIYFLLFFCELKTAATVKKNFSFFCIFFLYYKGFLLNKHWIRFWKIYKKNIFAN